MTAEIFELTQPSLAAMLQRQTQIAHAASAVALERAFTGLRGCAPDADVVLALWRQALNFDPVEQLRVIEFVEDAFDQNKPQSGETA